MYTPRSKRHTLEDAARRRSLRARIKRVRAALERQPELAPRETALTDHKAAVPERSYTKAVPEFTSGIWSRPIEQTRVFDAITRAISESDGSAEHKSNQELEAAALLRFLEQAGVRTCGQLRTAHVAAYVASLKKADYSPSSIRHMTNPIRLLNRWMLTNFEKPPVAVQAYLPKRVEKDDKIYLDADQLRQAYAMAGKRKYRHAQLMIALMGCAGLRLTEVMRLEPADLRRGDAGDVLWIGSHGAKNLPSVRCIPIAGFVADELQAFWSEGREMFRTRYPLSCQVRWTFDACAATAGNAASGSDNVFAKAAAKDLRKSLANILKGRVGKDELRAYYGHSTQDMLSRFYEAMTPKPKMASSVRDECEKHLRREIVDAVDMAFPGGLK